MEFIPMYVDEPQNRKPGDIIKNTDWNNLFNLLMTQGNYNTDALLEITQTYPTTAQMQSAISQQIIDIGAGDMAKAIYDTNADGVVDLAETVVDGGITTDKIADNAINENKLSDLLLQYITHAYDEAIIKSRVKFGKISDLTPSSTQQGATDQYTTTNQYKTYNIGFTPDYLFIFNFNRALDGNSNQYNFMPSLGEYYHGSSHSHINYNGGIAYPNNTISYGYPTGSSYPTAQEVFRITSGGFRTHEYYYVNTDKIVSHYYIRFDDSYYLAIG